MGDHPSQRPNAECLKNPLQIAIPKKRQFRLWHETPIDPKTYQGRKRRLPSKSGKNRVENSNVDHSGGSGVYQDNSQETASPVDDGPSPSASHARVLASTSSSINDEPNIQQPNCSSAATSVCDNDGKQSQVNRIMSAQRIPFEAPRELKDRLQLGLLASIPKEEDIFLFVPDSGRTCPYCQSDFDLRSPVDQKWIAQDYVTVVLRTVIAYGRTFYRPCLKCDHHLIYDGRSDGFLNTSSHLFGYDTLRDYMHSFLHGRRPLHTHFVSWLDNLQDYDQPTSALTYQDWRGAWNAFVHLLDIPLESGFTCPICQAAPDIVICDGTSVSFQRRMMPDTKETTEEDESVFPCSTFSERVFLPVAQVRRLLMRFATSRVNRKKGAEPLSSSDIDQLVKLSSSLSTSLSSLLTLCRGNPHLLSAYRDLLVVLASPSAACSFLPPTKDMADAMKAITSGCNILADPMLLTVLQRRCPILFDLLTTLQSIPPELRQLLVDIWKVSLKPFERPCPKSDDMDTVTDSNALAFFPSLLSRRFRGRYKSDKKSSSALERCPKHHKGHPSLLPGIFTLFCPHGICYGFEVMVAHESPNVPFTVLLTRFETAPKAVVYDNACSLHAYCLNRRPHFFQETVFYVDRLHWFDHAACSPAYELSRYRHLMFLNSQLNEQANAGLNRIKAQVSYMSYVNFMRHISLYLWNWNRRKMALLS